MKAIPILLLLALLVGQPALAAFKSSADEASPESAWNPRPLKDDVVLPMPCGQSLALRAVAVPSGALIRDKSFPMGITNSGDGDRQIYERQFTGHIAAPFTLRDLPKAWQLKVAANHKNAGDDAWYFIGKYEISRMQWDSVMNAIESDGSEDAAQCPKSAGTTGNLPITGISWFEAQEFLNKYNAWLVRNHIRDLPAFSGTQNIAFLRLPTEEEWEYAARGGNAVAPEWWTNNDIFPFDNGLQLKDYAVFSEDGAKQNPLGIGSRAPNRLGIHDTAGNAGEMVDGFFRMSIADMANGQVVRRLHGAAGGILTKGGSFRSEKEAIMPGARDEIPLYTASGPSRPTDLGLRVALAGLNIPNAQRLAELRKEVGNQVLLQQEAPDIKGDTPLEMVDSLVSKADPALKDSLRHLRGLLEDQDAAQTSQELKNLEQSCRSLLYQSETLRAFAFRHNKAIGPLEKLRKVSKEPMDQATRAKLKQALEAAEGDIRDYLSSLQMGANYYKSTLATISQQPKRETDRLMAQFRREYGSDSIFDQHMRHNVDILEEYLEIMRRGDSSRLNSRTILKGILPPNHYKELKL